MHKMFALTVIALVALTVGFPRPAVAQLRTAKDAPIVYGHHHLNVTDPAAHQRFWVDTLGGRLVILGEGDAIAFPNVFVLLTPVKPAGGTQGSSVDHLGFQVQNLAAVLDKVRAGGYRILAKAELTNAIANTELTTPTANVELATQAATAALPTLSAVGGDAIAVAAPPAPVAYVMGPDKILVELVEVPGSPDPIALHHVHFYSPEASAMQAWYASVFGASTPSGVIDSMTLPGVGLMFTPSDRPVAGTKGRALDHVS